MGVVLKAENISKQYRLGQVGTGTLSHDLRRSWYKIRGKEDPYLQVGDVNDRAGTDSSEYVWALKDINFEINQGDVVGIIGKNGAGKSTLLKLLSRVTGPTTGNIYVNGRVATLLEVGTGFHPELTGRENIYLNGAILGMRRSEIKSKLDEIVEFSGCNKYIDTPVKRYSSGMIVRLGFAVAAHLDPEILIVDEVLAVGDAEFQERCIGKMKDISGTGRTVLFVSHNMASIKALCERGILMDKGGIGFEGDISETIGLYLSSVTKVNDSGIIPDDASSINSGKAKFKKLRLVNNSSEGIDKIHFGQNLNFELELEVNEEISDCILDLRLNTIDGIELVHSMNKYQNESPTRLTSGRKKIKCSVQNKLQPGRYSVTIGVHETNGVTIDYVESILDFTVLNVASGDDAGFVYDFKLGYVRFDSKWEIE